MFMGQFFWISNILYIFLSQTGRYILGNMHKSLDFQLLTGNLIISAILFYFFAMKFKSSPDEIHI